MHPIGRVVQEAAPYHCVHDDCVSGYPVYKYHSYENGPFHLASPNRFP